MWLRGLLKHKLYNYYKFFIGVLKCIYFIIGSLDRIAIVIVFY